MDNRQSLMDTVYDAVQALLVMLIFIPIANILDRANID